MSERQDHPDPPVALDGSAGDSPAGREAVAATTLLDNPIFIRCVREKLRMKELVPWALVTLVMTAFIFLVAYLTQVERAQVSHELAAKTSMIILLVLQGFILMLLGTGSVASGMALERDTGVIDYQRLTPMSPLSKIIGYLFGLPVREYVLFLITMPFLLYCVIVSKTSVFTLIKFYSVFTTSVLLYHMIGMVAGMVSVRRRRIGWIARAVVVVLYLLLPLFAGNGLRFLEHLTIRPTFFIIVAEELADGWAELGRNPAAVRDYLDRASEVPFFFLRIHSSVFAILVQGFLVYALYTVVSRKWKEDSYHAFSKGFSLVFFGVMQVLLLGAVWAYLTDDTLFEELRNKRHWVSDGQIIARLAISYFLLGGMLIVMLLHLITPTRFTQLRGIRRAMKHDRSSVSMMADASSSVFYGFAFIAGTLVCFLALFYAAQKYGRLYDVVPPMSSRLLLCLMFVAAAASAQAARELFEPRGFFVYIFIAWVCPVLVGIVVAVPFVNLQVPAAYIASPSPLFGLLYAVFNMCPPETRPLVLFDGLQAVAPHAPILAGTATFIYLSQSFVLYSMLFRKHQALEQERQHIERSQIAAIDGPGVGAAT